MLRPTDRPLGLVDGKLLDTDFPDPFAGGQLLGYLPFRGEDSGSPLIPGMRNGAGHGMRRIIDPASFLMPGSRVTPADDFFIRTGYPELLRPPDDWRINLAAKCESRRRFHCGSSIPSWDLPASSSSSSAREIIAR